MNIWPWFFTAPLMIMSQCCVLSAAAIVNGNFESGNNGFSSGYAYVVSGTNALVPEGVYTIDNNPHNNQSSFTSMNDHTPGGGNRLMMIVNGASSTGVVVWQGSLIPSLEIGRHYDFSAWVTSVNPTSPAQLVFRVGTVDIATLSPPAASGWVRLQATFVAMTARPSFYLLNSNPAANGNDFALDDIDVYYENTTTPVEQTPETRTMESVAAGVGLILVGASRKPRRLRTRNTSAVPLEDE